MSRYYSDSDDDYTLRRRRSGSIQGSGWQSPLPTLSKMTSLPRDSSTTRIVVESPFHSKKCDYSIDKSQRGRLIITARRRYASTGNYRSSNNKNQVAVQTFTIPWDADVDRLQSHVERDSNRLIIEIPRQHGRTSRMQQHSSHLHSNNRSSRLLRSPDIERMLTPPMIGPQVIRDVMKTTRRSSGSGSSRKLEYRFDCHGYTSDELEVFIQGRDLIVQGRTKSSNNTSDPNHQRVSKKFSRKITLPHSVDLTRVVSYLEHGELRIEAPLKRGAHHTDEEIIIPGPPPTSTRNHRTTTTLTSNLENRLRSLSPVNRTHYRRNEHHGRRRDYDRPNYRRSTNTVHRVRSADNLPYPLYVSARDLEEDGDDDDDSKERDSRRQRTAVFGRSATDRKEPERTTVVYSPVNVVTSTRTHTMTHPSDDENNLKF